MHIYRNICHIMVAVINWHYTSLLSFHMSSVNMIWVRQFTNSRRFYILFKSRKCACDYIIFSGLKVHIEITHDYGMPGVKSFKRRFSASQKYFTGRSGGLRILITKIWWDLTCTTTHSISYLIVVYFVNFFNSKGHDSHTIHEIKYFQVICTTTYDALTTYQVSWNSFQ